MEDVQGISNSLILAASEGNLEEVKQLIYSYGLHYSNDWSQGYALLNCALRNNHTEVAKLLLISGAKVNNKSVVNTTTPLHFAAINNNIEVIKILLDKGAYVNAKDEYGKTPLYSAVEYQGIEIIKLLLAYNADVNYLNTSCPNQIAYSPLHFAIRYNYKEIITVLLNNGANINIKGKNNMTPLYIASKQGFEDSVELLLNRGANVNATTNYKLTPLHIATTRGHQSIVKLLLKHGANVDAQTIYGETIPNLAIETGCSMIVQDILNYRPKINNTNYIQYLKTVVDQQGEEYKKILKALLEYGFIIHAKDRDLLHFAIQGGHLKIVESLLKHSTDVNYLLNWTVKENYTPLHTAAINKQEEIGELLVSYGADINAQDNTGKTPLFYAVQNADVKLAKLLLSNGTNIEDNSELLIIAIQKNCLEIVEFLMHFDVDIYTVNEYGWTALHLTTSGANQNSSEFLTKEDPIINAKAAIAKLLLSKGVNVNAKTKHGLTALHLATINRYQKVIEVLLQYNADINVYDEFGMTALHYSATLNEDIECFLFGYKDDSVLKIKEEIAKLLLSNGANVDAKTENGQTTLHFAAEYGYVKIIEVLLQYNVDISTIDTNGRTALHFIALQDFRSDFRLLESVEDHIVNIKAECAKLLLSKGANVNAQTYRGLTTLHAAAERGYLKVVEVLLEYDADINVCDVNGRTALLYTVKKRSGRPAKDNNFDAKNKIVKLLLSNGANVYAKTIDGITALHEATKRGYEKIVEMLLEHNVDANCRSPHGFTPLHVAAENGFLEIINIILKFGVDVNSVDDFGRTALYNACLKNDRNAITTLLNHGSEFSFVRTNGQTYFVPYMFEFMEMGSCSNSDNDRNDGIHPEFIVLDEETFDIFKRQVIKFKVAKFYVSKRNIHLLRCNKMDKYKAKCKQEIANMKCEKINAEFTFYDFLMEDINSLAIYLKNENIVQVLNSKIYETKFPEYAEMITCNFRMATYRIVLQERGIKIFHFLFTPELPYDCIENIVIYLSNEDIKVLLDIDKRN